MALSTWISQQKDTLQLLISTARVLKLKIFIINSKENIHSNNFKKKEKEKEKRDSQQIQR